MDHFWTNYHTHSIIYNSYIAVPQMLAESLCAILLLEESSPRQVLSEFILARKATLQEIFHPYQHGKYRFSVIQSHLIWLTFLLVVSSPCSHSDKIPFSSLSAKCMYMYVLSFLVASTVFLLGRKVTPQICAYTRII